MADNDGTFTWEKLGLLVPVAVAVGFACSASYMIGLIIGLGNIGIIRVIEFSDVADTAVPIASLYAVITGISVALGKPVERLHVQWDRKRGKPTRWPLFAALGALALVGPTLAALDVIPWHLCFVVLAFEAAAVLATGFWFYLTYPKIGYGLMVFGSFTLMGLLGCFAIGVTSGETSLEPRNLVSVKTKDAVLVAHASLLLDRGIVLIEPFGFMLVDVHEIQTIMYIDRNRMESIKR